jgi:succinate dehydrogenase / fumarate reductase iron-sulfur subunit
MAADHVTMLVWRGEDRDEGDFQEFRVAAQEGEVVLDVIHRIQATQAGDLAVRWNCKAGRCGSCSAEINGQPRLMCMTRMNLFPDGEPISVAPIKAFPVVKDLVTDVSFNYEMAKRVPAFKPRPKDPKTEADGHYRMQQEDFVRYAELEMHPLDTSDRRELLRQRMGIGLCNITKCCTEVCPEDIHITDNAIIPLKERVADQRYDPIRRIARRFRPSHDDAAKD